MIKGRKEFSRRRRLRIATALLLLAGVTAACGSGGDGKSALTVYSGRSEDLVGPLLNQFTDLTNIDIKVRYADTPELAALILDEGDNSNADVFFAQDAGALGAVAKAGRFSSIPKPLLDRVPEGFRSPKGLWVGTSGRARTVVYNPQRLAPGGLPDTMEGFTDSKWSGKIGWAPSNASFQSFVTAFRIIRGDDAAANWLKAIKKNGARSYPNNAAVVKAVSDGEVDVGFANHYYVYELAAEDPDLKAANAFMKAGDPGNLVNAAGAGIIKKSGSRKSAERFVEFVLSPRAQSYFAAETFEYPLVKGIKADPRLPALEEIGAPKIDLSDLDRLTETQEMLKDTGVL